MYPLIHREKRTIHSHTASIYGNIVFNIIGWRINSHRVTTATPPGLRYNIPPVTSGKRCRTVNPRLNRYSVSCRTQTCSISGIDIIIYPVELATRTVFAKNFAIHPRSIGTPVSCTVVPVPRSIVKSLVVPRDIFVEFPFPYR